MPRKDVTAEDELAGEQQSLGMDPAYKPLARNPNFDPPFRNDHRLVQRGFFKGLMHFVNKNTDSLSKSIYDRVASSFKFAGCVNNYSELRRRYRRLIELENAEHSPGRVRFINYYTASTGRISQKTKKPEKVPEDVDQTENPASPLQKGPETPSISEEDGVSRSVGNLALDGQDLETSESSSVCKEAKTSTTTNTTPEEQSTKSTTVDLRPQAQAARPPPLPPRAPHASRQDLQDSATEEPRSEKDQSSLDLTSTLSPTSLHQDSQSLSGSVSLTTSDSGLSSDTSPQKLRKFILLPSHHWKQNDNTHWTPVVMEDMDEVVAHQSMFIPHGANYDFLVGDTVTLIEQWVQSDLSRRLMQESLD